MTIDEAYELLQQDIENPGSVEMTELNEAEQLGIEALKEVERLRPHIQYCVQQLLPGETKK